LLERIIEISSNPRDVVLDVMCGSGTTLVASRNLGRKFIGIDNNLQAVKISKSRLKELHSKKTILEKPLLKY